ncbi:signal transduction histidine kinase [Nonomuraea muscovyensis]|uniref:histidine kinase n=1 Tax=Nonomuraea muscovyensis TaxID=1124761 RepID=A0A7X0BYI8_9ACTN|nr:histidine kinase [Nonomuraea muscovyensis]MBB6344130.1 signal transduction histidine kinase [Nonomuraea muscovyensis]
MSEPREHVPEYRWVLPSVLLGDGDGRRPVRRSTRDWIVDIVMFLAACLLALLGATELDGEPDGLVLAEQVTGALSCAAVWLRRRWPVTLALVSAAMSSYLELVGGASVVGLFTVAVHRPFKISGPVAAFNIVALVPLGVLRPDPSLGPGGMVVLGVAIVATAFAWGIVVRARRQLVWSLRQRAVIAAEDAKRLERERIAREMHDVLAHRISMLSLHAGALEFRPDAPAEDIARAASAIRDNAHLALQDLREVIGVLRHASSAGGDGPVPDPPQPTLADLRSLVEECRQAGMKVSYTAQLTPEAEDVDTVVPTAASGIAEGDVPQGLGRTVYRVVQEALTNARKHAPDAPVTVTVRGGPGEGLTAEVRNPRWAHHGRRIPGAGAGLIGLTERVELAGGTLAYGPEPDGDFRLRAWLPWSP